MRYDLQIKVWIVFRVLRRLVSRYFTTGWGPLCENARVITTGERRFECCMLAAAIYMRLAEICFSIQVGRI